MFFYNKRIIIVILWKIKPVFSYLCKMALPTFAAAAAVYRYILPAGPTAAAICHCVTMQGQTDGRMPYHFIDHAMNNMQAVPITTHASTIYIKNTLTLLDVILAFNTPISDHRKIIWPKHQPRKADNNYKSLLTLLTF